MTTAITLAMLIVYIAIMMGIGIYTASKTKSVSDFVLGGNSVGSWLTAFALWNIVFFRCCIHWLCWTVWVELRGFVHMDWNRKCCARQCPCMAGTGQTYPTDE